MPQEAQKIEPKELVVAEFGKFDRQMIEFKDKYDDVVYDLDDADQDKQARSDRFAIGKVVSALDSKHKELKAPLKAKTDLIDGERKRIKDSLLDVQSKIKSQIDDHERKIQEHAEMLQDKVEAIRAMVEFDAEPNSGQIAVRLAEVQAIDVNDSYEHRKADATLAQVETVKTLEAARSNRVIYELEQAELELLRKQASERAQAEREEQIRVEATEKATRDAEEIARALEVSMELERQAALKEAERSVAEAARKQLEAEQATDRAAQAERERIEAELRQAAEEAARIKQGEDAKKAKQSYRAKIHGEAKQTFMDNGFDAAESEVIVSLIKDGKIKNIQINY